MKVLALIFVLLFCSCTHLNSVSVTSIPKERKEKVKAERYKFVFLLMNFNNKFVEEMEKELAEKCHGKIQGIVTKTESITYFPIIAHAYNITAEGYCVK
jgi:hypothetical protein